MTASALVFSPGSIQGSTQCIEVQLFHDILLEAEEDFVLELNTFDPALIVSEDADLAIVTIIDVPHPQGIIRATIERNSKRSFYGGF